MARARRRRCPTCGELLPKNARANQKYCDADCRRGKAKPVHQLEPLGAVGAATEEAIAQATTEQRLGKSDAGAVAALRVLARKIDSEDQMRELALQAAADSGGKPPPIDNVSIPTYLKYCESLGLTPAGRRPAATTGKGEGGTKSGGTSSGGLRGLATVPRPA